MSQRPSWNDLGSRRRRILLGSLAGGFFVLIVLGLLALPLLGVPADARAAKDDLADASAALKGDDTAAARQLVTSAREHVDAASDSTEGLGGDVWSLLPFLGTPVEDARHLVRALDEVTSVAEIGVDLYPRVAGRRATLVREQRIDEATLDAVVAGVRDVRDRLTSAQAELDQVRATTPLVSDTIAAQRDAAAAEVDPVVDGLADLEPVLDVLPTMLGFDNRQSYLIAMLNPSELRYSGGAALTFAPLTFDEGAFELGDSKTVANDPRLLERRTWPQVEGNPFHARRNIVLNSTFAPSWSVSGEELLRSWRRTHGKHYQGVIAVDVIALAKLLGAAGGMTVPGYGELNEGNLVETLVGSYARYYPDPSVQDALNDSLIPVFKDTMLRGGNYLAKARAFGEAAEGRHFALYFRDPDVQDAISQLDLAGDLTPAKGDYLGVFTQNRNQSKVDYWQKRHLSLEVQLAEDGSARDNLEVTVLNDTPPSTVPVEDIGIGYFTRYSGMSVATFLPPGAEMAPGWADGEPASTTVGAFRDHTYVQQRLDLVPSSASTLEMAYRVPAAASVDESGDLVYQLAFDPQGTVNPQSVDIAVRVPRGYQAASSLPEGWSARDGVLRYSSDALDTTQEWRLPLSKVQ